MLSKVIIRKLLLLLLPLLSSVFFLILLFRVFPARMIHAEPNGTILLPGDLAIIGVASDIQTDFAFVLLVDIAAGTEIKFTDSGWLSTNEFRGYEGATKYTAPTDLLAGTMITYQADNSNFTNANNEDVGYTGFDISTSGDQVFAFQGETSNPGFIYAVQSNSTEWQATASGSWDSALPSGLVNGVSAVAVGAGSYHNEEYDNAVYDMSVTEGNQVRLLQAISNQANWTGSDNPLGMPTGNFTVHVPIGSLEITKSAPPAAAQWGDFEYTIVVTNSTRTSVSQIQITDTLPTGVMFVEASDGGQYSGGVVNWTIPGPLPKDETRELTIDVQATGSLGYSITNADYGVTASEWITVARGAPVTTMIYPIDVILEQQGYWYAPLGQTLMYTVTIQNTGNQAATNIVLRNYYPENLSSLQENASVSPIYGIDYLEWDFGTQPVGWQTSFQIFITPDGTNSIGDTITNTTTISVDNENEATWNNEQSVKTTFIEDVTIEDIQYAPDPETDDQSPRLGDTVLVSGTITAKAGEIGEGDTLMFIQDSSGDPWTGIAVYAPLGHDRTDLSEGMVVQVVGTVSEITDGDNTVTALTISQEPGSVKPMQSGSPLQPVSLLTSDLPEDSPAISEAWESMLVSFDAVDITSTDLGDGDWQINDGSGPVRVSDEGGLDGNLNFIPQLDDHLTTINGIIWQTAAGYQSLPRYTEDIRMEYVVNFTYHDEEDVILPGENLNLLLFTDGEGSPTTYAMVPDDGWENFSQAVPLEGFGSYNYRYSYTGIQQPDADYWVNTSDRSVVISQPNQTIEDYRNIEIAEVQISDPESFIVPKLNLSPPVTAKVKILYLTNQDGPARGLLSQIGFGVEAAPGEWPEWFDLDHTYNDSGTSFYEGALMSEEIGVYPFLVRFNPNYGENNPHSEWIYGDMNGFLPDDPIDLGNAGEMTVTTPDLNVSNSISPVSDARPGSPLTIAITIANSTGTLIGPAYVILTDTLPTEIEIVDDWLPAELQYFDVIHTVTWRGDINPGETQSFEIPVKIKNTSLLSAGHHQFNNQVAVSDGAGNLFEKYSETIIFDVFAVFLPMILP